ncbi:MAG: hypothetical protein GY947_07855 [Rhodobacteraceae bacterium]|nr:hypothetical protein [Paracoccaceae bacterium]
MNQNQHLDVQSDAGLKISPAFGAVCNALHDIVNEGIDVHRCLAAKALGRIGATESAPTLINALLDEDEDVRTDAAEALRHLAAPQACDQLLENLLGDPCTEVKLAAIQTLAKLQDQRVVPWLRRLVAGRDEEIIWDEAEFYSSGWDDWVDVQIKAVEALAKLGAVEAVPDIVAAMQDENSQDMAEVAFKALSKLGPDGITALTGYLTQPDARVRRRAAAVLATIESSAASAALAKALIDPAAEVRIAALKARSGCNPKDRALAGLLRDADTGVRVKAVQLVGRYYPEPMFELLDDSSDEVRAAALSAFADVEKSEMPEKLAERMDSELDSSSTEVVVAVAHTFSKIDPLVAVKRLSALFTDADQPAAVRLAALRGLSGVGGDQVLQLLVEAIGDDIRQIRLEAMSSLAKLAGRDGQRPNPALTALLAALGGAHDPEVEEEVETPALEAEKPATEPVAAESEDDEGVADEFPASTLGSILSDAPGIASAAGLPEDGVELSDNDMERLAMARRVIGKKKIAISQEVVRHQDIRRYAARVLGDLDGGDLADALADTLKLEDRETRIAAADSLARIGERTGRLSEETALSLLDALGTEDRELKVLLVRALAACDGDQVTNRLNVELGNPDSFVRAEAIRALSLIGQVGPEVQNLLHDPDPSVRLHAAQAVARNAGTDAIQPLVDFALSFEGYHGRQTARLLRDLDATEASATFLRFLDDPEKKRFWSVVIGALEELNQKHTEVWQH